ncbi:MAG: ion transporter [Chloroflexi bacterium]|nr:ion transporter [Chloroflexota bacterium]
MQRRQELQQRIAAWADIPLTVLALVMLALFVVELTVPLDPIWSARLGLAETAIWAVFVVDFVMEFALAPSKGRYLQQHWLAAISILLPAVRALRVLRFTRVVRSFTVVRLGTVLNRGIGAIGHVFERGEFGYVLLLAVAVTVTAAAGAYFLERGQPNATITSPGEALWWATTLMTTMGSNLEAVSVEARFIGLVLRVVALGISGYITATIAVYLLGVRSPGQRLPPQELEELRKLRRDVSRLVARPGRSRPGRNDRGGRPTGGPP